jgi:hypothetical protein
MAVKMVKLLKSFTEAEPPRDSDNPNKVRQERLLKARQQQQNSKDMALTSMTEAQAAAAAQENEVTVLYQSGFMDRGGGERSGDTAGVAQDCEMVRRLAGLLGSPSSATAVEYSAAMWVAKFATRPQSSTLK